MNIKPWIPLVAASALLLAACGNGEEQEAPAQEEALTQEEAPVQEEAPAQEEAPVADESLPEAAADESLPAQEAPGEEEVPGDEVPEPSPQEGLTEEPGSLDEQSAMPGETTDSDIDQFLEETERRFEEAQRRIDEQFEEAESQAPGEAAFDEAPAAEPEAMEP